MIGTSILGLSSLSALGISLARGEVLYHFLFVLSILCGASVISIALGTRILKLLLR